MKIDGLIEQLVWQGQTASPQQVEQIVKHIAAAPFTTALLEVDQPLWGGFWQLDVITPGYRLPAVELALLRAMRLDGGWPEGASVAEFLADLRAAIVHPLAGVWSLAAAGAPCVVMAGPGGDETRPAKASTMGALIEGRGERFPANAAIPAALATIAWYCAATGQLHAGYRTAAWPGLPGAIEQRPPRFELSASGPQLWVKELENEGQDDLAARLDAEICRLRAR
jgi:hypothetical protein